MPDLILASQSPRRRDLLNAAGFVFTVIPPDVDETPRSGESPEVFACRVAADKARAVAGRLPPDSGPRVIVGCDTVVTIDGEILGKPSNKADAARMLHQLSGRVHQVISGLCVLLQTAPGDREEKTQAVVTEVEFRALTETEIFRYVSTGDPMDKAGAYAIQGGAAHLVAAARGSYTNVIGLPVEILFPILDALGVSR
ncbi:MAG: Maf family protein [Kiritimatiellia bacterium]|nr:Maf family protein [Kiritimatiellia bacterium]